MPADCLRKLRLLCEDFPRSHNLVLIGQPPLLQSLSLTVNEEIRSRVTYSVVLPRLSPETIKAFILGQLDRAGLGHNTFTPEAHDRACVKRFADSTGNVGVVFGEIQMIFLPVFKIRDERLSTVLATSVSGVGFVRKNAGVCFQASRLACRVQLFMVGEFNFIDTFRISAIDFLHTFCAGHCVAV